MRLHTYSRPSARGRRAGAGLLAAIILAGCGVSAASESAPTSSTSSATASSDASATDEATPETTPESSPESSSDSSSELSTRDTDANAADGTVAAALADNLAVSTAEVSYDEASATTITLSGSTATLDGSSDGVTVDGDTVRITAAGTYVLTGELDGQVVVSSRGAGVVRLVLADASITSSTGPAITVTRAEAAAVVLAEGTSNTLADAQTYADTSADAPTGTLYSSDDLTIGGTGALAVSGNNNNGIVSNAGLVILDGTIDVTAVDDGILGEDYLVLTSGTVTVDAVGDGVKADKLEAGAGFVLVEGGELVVNSEDDGIKGLQVLISGGDVTVAGSLEAVEGERVIIDGGAIELHAADDAINAAASDAALQDLLVRINGGTLEVWASGDGIDSNGDAMITGGDIVVYGPTAQNNGALDADGRFGISGGTLMAVGSAGMMVAPATDAAQGWLATALPSTATAGSRVVITDADGQQVAAQRIEKDFASVVFSSDAITAGQTYTVTVAGTSTTVTAGVAPAGRGWGG